LGCGGVPPGEKGPPPAVFWFFFFPPGGSPGGGGAGPPEHRPRPPLRPQKTHPRVFFGRVSPQPKKKKIPPPPRGGETRPPGTWGGFGWENHIPLRKKTPAQKKKKGAIPYPFPSGGKKKPKLRCCPPRKHTAKSFPVSRPPRGPVPHPGGLAGKNGVGGGGSPLVGGGGGLFFFNPNPGSPLGPPVGPPVFPVPGWGSKRKPRFFVFFFCVFCSPVFFLRGFPRPGP